MDNSPLPENQYGFHEAHLDLDGLFADFEAGVVRLTGKTPDQLDPDEMWKAIDADPYFFEDLPIMKGSEELWELVKHTNNLKFLTGATSTQRFRTQKRIWVARRYGSKYEVNVVPSETKSTFAGPGKVLIDDNLDNIDAWIAAGGIGIHHQGDYKQTAEKFLATVKELTKPYN